MSRKKKAASATPSPPSRLPGAAVPGPRLNDAPGLVLLIDQQEKLGYDFTGICPFIVKHLRTGDYSVSGLEESITIERKEISDLWGTIICDRPRFEREMSRMSTFERGVILVEGTIQDVIDFRPIPKVAAKFTPAQLMAHPKTIINSLVSWSIECGVHVCYASKDRNICRAMVLSEAKRWWRLKRKGGPPDSTPIPSDSDSVSGEAAPAA